MKTRVLSATIALGILLSSGGCRKKLTSLLESARDLDQLEKAPARTIAQVPASHEVTDGNNLRAIQDFDQSLKLDPKFAEAARCRMLAYKELATTGSAPAAVTAPSSASVDAGRLIGKWRGGRHVTQYFANGTFILDPDITPQPIRESVSRWRVEGNSLITTDAAGTHNYTIVSLTSRELVTKDEQGRTYREKRISP